MKIDRLLQLTKDLYPTEFSDAVLLMWLSQCENSILTEINLLAVSECTELQQVTDAELSVPHPYDKLYLPYMQAMICQANGETDKYVNHMQIYNTFRDEYARWVCAVIAPAYGEARKEGYYLSAYALAKERGFAGTVDDWLESLKGLPGSPGAPGEAVLPVALAESRDGAYYTAYGEDLPDMVLGRQIIAVPQKTNTIGDLELEINDQHAFPVRLRTHDGGQTLTMPVPVGAFVQNIPYTLTFAGDCWLVDSIAGVDLPSGFINAMKNIQDEDVCGIPLLDNTGNDPRYILMHIVRSLAEKDTGILTVPSMERLYELLLEVYKRIDGISTTDDGLVIYFGKTIPEDAPDGSILIDLSGQDGGGVSKEMLEAIVAEALSEGVQDIVAEAVKEAVKDAIPQTLHNPFALTFTGAAEGSYDGSKAVTVNIPQGGVGSCLCLEDFELIDTIDFSKPEMSKPGAIKSYDVKNVTEIVVVWQNMGTGSTNTSAVFGSLQGRGPYDLFARVGTASSKKNGYTYFKVLRGCGTMVWMPPGAAGPTNYGQAAGCIYNLLPINQPISNLSIQNHSNEAYMTATGTIQVYVR